MVLTAMTAGVAASTARMSSFAVWFGRSVLDTKNSVAAAASGPVSRHATVRCNLFTTVPIVVAGWMPNSRISNGAMGEPPPTPVMPTRSPTPRPSAA